MDRTALLAGIYQCLAEALAEPTAGWLAASGRGWPLYSPVLKLAAGDENPRWQEAFIKITAVPAAGIEIRREEFRQALAPILLYECHHLDGRFPGPMTFSVKKIYEQAGLEVKGAEMPDHASAELAFLAHLCEREASSSVDAKERRTVRRLFIQHHAGKWLPQVAGKLLHSGSPAWEAVGAVLAASVLKKPGRVAESRPETESPSQPRQIFPGILAEEDCILCGFCVQVCPSQALYIHEDEAQTELWLQPQKCVGCGKCEQACGSGALALVENDCLEPQRLRHSARAICPQCGAPTVSQAELNAVAARLGEHPAWLDACLNCR